MPDGAGGFRQGFSSPALLRIPLGPSRLLLQGFHLVSRTFPGNFEFSPLPTLWSYYPGMPVSTPVWALPLSLATTYGITVVFSSCRYLDVSVPCVSLLADLLAEGLPHSDIFGSSVACTYPKLFAACHVLHRLQMPRHSPYTLTLFLPKLVPEMLCSQMRLRASAHSNSFFVTTVHPFSSCQISSNSAGRHRAGCRLL